MWLGHYVRLDKPDKETPARQALVEYTKPVKRKIGRPRLTCINQVYQDLKSSNIDDVYNFRKRMRYDNWVHGRNL